MAPRKCPLCTRPLMKQLLKPLTDTFERWACSEYPTCPYVSPELGEGAEAIWVCGRDEGCGWTGRASELKPNASGIMTCPECGASGGLHPMKQEPPEWIEARIQQLEQRLDRYDPDWRNYEE